MKTLYSRLHPCIRCDARTLYFDGLCASCREATPPVVEEERRIDNARRGFELSRRNEARKLSEGFALLGGVTA